MNRGWVCESDFPSCILVNIFWRWACRVVSSLLCKATGSRGKINLSTKEWRWWCGYISMIFLFQMASFVLDWTLGSIHIHVTPANLWHQQLNQAADRMPFTNKGVGIKGSLFPFKQYKPLKYVVLLQAGSIKTWCHVVFKNTQSRRNEMASIRQSFYMESNGKAEMGLFPWKWSARSQPDISVTPFFISVSL